jgi:hypothetical protein
VPFPSLPADVVTESCRRQVEAPTPAGRRGGRKDDTDALMEDVEDMREEKAAEFEGLRTKRRKTSHRQPAWPTCSTGPEGPPDVVPRRWRAFWGASEYPLPVWLLGFGADYRDRARGVVEDPGCDRAQWQSGESTPPAVADDEYQGVVGSFGQLGDRLPPSHNSVHRDVRVLVLPAGEEVGEFALSLCEGSMPVSGKDFELVPSGALSCQAWIARRSVRCVAAVSRANRRAVSLCGEPSTPTATGPLVRCSRMTMTGHRPRMATLVLTEPSSAAATVVRPRAPITIIRALAER